MTNNQLTENSVTQLLNNVRLARDNAERDDNRVDHSFYYALTRALEELQERRKAERDSEPVVFTDERNLHHIAMGRETSLIWGKHNSEAGDVPLYRHAQQPVVPRVTCWSCRNQVEISAIGGCDGYCPECDAPIDLGEEPYTSEQPVPVVPDIDELRLAFEAAERESDDGFNLHKYGIGYADDETQGRWDTWLACRAAMLNGGKS